jgi:alpha-tubulin suppressor-like RCC1 family protein
VPRITLLVLLAACSNGTAPLVITKALTASDIAVDQVACALTQTGAPACWGYPNNLAAGYYPPYDLDGDGADSVPELVPNAPVLRSIFAGPATSCGITVAGIGYCWGATIPVANLCPMGGCESELETPNEPPTPVPGGMSLVQIALGGQMVITFGPMSAFACLLTTSHSAYCYGQNAVGQLGDGQPTPADSVQATPVAVTGSHIFAQLTAGAFFACGVETGGAVYCWGADSVGQLGDGGAIMRPSPVRVGGGLTAKSIVAGARHACALQASGAAYCWGANTGGQLGDGTTTNRAIPVAVRGGLTFAMLAAGGDVTCGITMDGAAYCWGIPEVDAAPDYAPANFNVPSSLGDGRMDSRATPTAVTGGLTFHSIATSGSVTCGVTNHAYVVCWGNDWYGELGAGEDYMHRASSTPVAVSPL